MTKIFALIFFMSVFNANAQKKISDLTIEYEIKLNAATGNNILEGSTQVVFLKNQLSRSEMKTPFGTFINIKDNKTGTAIQLQETGNQKILIRLTKENVLEKNKKFEGVHFETTNETKIIAGYTCHKAIGKLNDGSVFTVYYTKELLAMNKDYNPQFNGLDGVPLEYESDFGKDKIIFSATKINLDPVASSKFELPTKLPGYTEMTYEESKKLK